MQNTTEKYQDAIKSYDRKFIIKSGLLSANCRRGT